MITVKRKNSGKFNLTTTLKITMFSLAAFLTLKRIQDMLKKLLKTLSPKSSLQSITKICFSNSIGKK